MKRLLSIVVLILLPNILWCKKYYMDGTFNGIESDSSKIVKILIIHGTGVKHYSYSYPLINNLANKLNFSSGECDTVHFYLNKNKSVTVDLFEFKNKTRKVHIYSVHWSELTKRLKEYLLAEDDLYNDFNIMERGTIAKLVKEDLFISQLSDFMLYNNPKIEKELNDALRLLLGLIVLDNSPTDHRQIPDFYINPKNHQTYFKTISELDPSTFNATNHIHAITGSLASSIIYNYGRKDSFFDALPINDTVMKAKIITKIRAYYKGCQGNLFMLTNQLNLLRLQYLDIHNPKNKTLDSIKSIFLKGLNIVAFRDPADPLCYHVPKKYFANPNLNVTVTNVIIKSKGPFDIFIKAHTKPFRNQELHHLIFDGGHFKRSHNKHVNGIKWPKKYDYSRRISYGN